MAVDGELLIGNAFDRLHHRQHARGLANLLFVGAVRSDPFGDEPFLLLVKRELFSPVLAMAFGLRSEIRTEAAVRLWGHLFRASLVSRDIEQHATSLCHDVALLGGRRWVRDGALSLI